MASGSFRHYGKLVWTNRKLVEQVKEHEQEQDSEQEQE
jgi:hypothetical protein